MDYRAALDQVIKDFSRCMECPNTKDQVDILFELWTLFHNCDFSKPLWVALKKHNHPTTHTIPKEIISGFDEVIDVDGGDNTWRVSGYGIVKNFPINTQIDLAFYLVTHNGVETSESMPDCGYTILRKRITTRLRGYYGGYPECVWIR